jgi:hypothetical protein
MQILGDLPVKSSTIKTELIVRDHECGAYIDE